MARPIYKLLPWHEPIEIATAGVTYLLLGGMLAFGGLRRHRALLLEHGVSPPAPTAAVLGVDIHPYRDLLPAARPAGGLVLPKEVRAEVLGRALLVACTFYGCALVLALSASGRVTCPVPLYTMQWGVVWTAALWIYQTGRTRRTWLLAMVATSAPALGLADLHLPCSEPELSRILSSLMALLSGLTWVVICSLVILALLVVTMMPGSLSALRTWLLVGGRHRR